MGKLKILLHNHLLLLLLFLLDLTHDNYIIVLQYANQGNLKEYLEKRFSTLKWKDKIKMALDITCGLKYLHSKQIIHRDLVI